MKRPSSPRPRVSLERALSKLGFASRTEARALILKGRVLVNGTVATDPMLRVDPARARIAVDGEPVRAAERVYIALHKPRGLVTTRRDEHGRDTVYVCFHGADLPTLVPVGRLDRDSEGLLLFTNDTRWAQRVLDPATHIEKRYEVHVSGPVAPELAEQLRAGVRTRRGEVLRAAGARVVRSGADLSVLEIVLEEGRNRQVRRMLEAQGLEVVRLLRRSIGPIRLGDLEPTRWRHLTDTELAAFGTLAPPPRTAPREPSARTARAPERPQRERSRPNDPEKKPRGRDPGGAPRGPGRRPGSRRGRG
jgi:23S rRNA pseudouridine2605 synthase